MPATRDFPFASVRVYDVGHGDPVVTDRGLGWYDVLAESFESGDSEVNANGLPLLEVIDGVGLCCKAFPVAKDTRLTHGTASGGSWEEERHSSGGDRAYRVTQYDSAATATAWSWTNNSQAHPADPQLAFSLLLPDTPSDWDFAAYPPFIRVELGASYGVQFGKDGTFLMRYISGAWQAVKSLPTPSRSSGYTDAEEVWCYVRVLRGLVCVSFDFGQSYTTYAPTGEAATIPSGKVILRGRGGAVTFGLHQLICYEADYDSQLRQLERPRASATTTFTGSRYDLNGGTVTFTDLGVPLSSVAQYRATLAPVAVTGTNWNWYQTPVLYATQYRIARVIQNIGTNYTTPIDDALVSIRISKPRALDGSTCTIVFEVNAFDANTLDGYKYRRVDVITGYRLSDGNTEEYASGTFYITEISAEWGAGEDFSKIKVTWTCVNLSGLLKQDGWTVLRQYALGGQTPNAAGDEILYHHGLNSSYRSWHAYGAAGLIPYGAAENPVELTNADEYPWETLVRIFEERYLEVGIDDSNVAFTLPLNYVSATVDDTLRATPVSATDERNQIERLAYRIDYRETADSAIVYATGENGQLVLSATYDADAQSDTASARFSPWRRTVQKRLDGTPNAAYALGHLQSLAQQTFQLPREADFSIPIDPRRSRRERLALYGFAGLGIPDATEFVLLTLEHVWERQQGLTSLKTTGGLARLDT